MNSNCMAMPKDADPLMYQREIILNLKIAINELVMNWQDFTQSPASLQIKPEIASTFDSMASIFVANFSKNTLRNMFAIADQNEVSMNAKAKSYQTYIANKLLNLFMQVYINKYFWIKHQQFVCDPIILAKSRDLFTLSRLINETETYCKHHTSTWVSQTTNTQPDFFTAILFYEVIKLNANILKTIRHLTFYNSDTSTQLFFNPQNGELEGYFKMIDLALPIFFKIEPSHRPNATDFDGEIKAISIAEIGVFINP